jgi:Domain of unknown function (DUF4384)/Putative peptidoglycan binding domain
VKFKLSCCVIAFSGVIQGCVMAPLDVRPVAKYLEVAPTHNRPVNRPARSMTSFTESLVCMDRMLRDYRIPTTLITSKQIQDPTGRAAVASKEMVITALSQMSRVSNAFRFVDYEVDIVRQDTVQNLTGLLLNANQIQLQRPALYISGAVAYVDQSVIRSGLQVGTSATRLETGASIDWNATVIGLEMHLGDFKTRTLIPGIDSSNELAFGSRGQGGDIAAKIGDYGLNFNLNRTSTMGSGAAVRTLVELSMIELVGKWARVPYWQCLMLDGTHPAIERQFRDWFESGKPSSEQPNDHRLEQVQRALTARGYFAGKIEGKVDGPTREAIAKYQADQQLMPTGTLTFELYQRLFKDYVVMDEQGQFQALAWEKVEAAAKTPDPLELKLAIANLKPMSSEFEVGERVYLQITPSRQAFIYCFYQDVKGRTSRIYPNPFQRGGASLGNSVQRIPDWLSINQGFALEANDGGSELVNCYASETDIFDRLAAPLQATAILPLPGVQNLQQVDADLARIGKDVSLTKTSIGWVVRAKPEKLSENGAAEPATTAK